MVQSIEQAEADNAGAVVFQLDTPGGLVESTRLIVKAILNANVPVVVYVSPSGGRAASAGTFITMAGHVAAMAPGTNIGAAHPVSGEGSDIEGDIRAKAGKRPRRLCPFHRQPAAEKRRLGRAGGARERVDHGSPRPGNQRHRYRRGGRGGPHGPA